MKVLIVGAGQIGTAIQELLSPYHEVHIRDIQDFALEGVEVLHICYPDGPFFVDQTRKYVAQYQPVLTLIHSSIAVGKTEKCGESVVHCPVRGRHPNLSAQIPAFPLFVGGSDKADVDRAVEYLSDCNLIARPVYDSKATELVKLLSNIHMGLEIAWRQEVGRILEHFAVDAKVYEDWEDTYNEGYRIVDNEQLTRPRLRPDPIGGHCILECTKILEKQFDSKAFEFIRDSNDAAKTKTNGHGDAREAVNA